MINQIERKSSRPAAAARSEIATGGAVTKQSSAPGRVEPLSNAAKLEFSKGVRKRTNRGSLQFYAGLERGTLRNRAGENLS
jgi:hypothetical protein